MRNNIISYYNDSNYNYTELFCFDSEFLLIFHHGTSYLQELKTGTDTLILYPVRHSDIIPSKTLCRLSNIVIVYNNYYDYTNSSNNGNHYYICSTDARTRVPLLAKSGGTDYINATFITVQ